MSTSNDNVDQSFSWEMLDDFRCHLDGIVLDSHTPENTTGAFGDLFTGTHPTEGKLALKRPRGDLYNARAVAAIEIEASVWKQLRHPYILQFLGIHTIDDSVYFVSPYAENGSLPEFIQRRPDVVRKRLVIEIAEGVSYLHQCAIVHGDLKGNNILISKFEHVQICDFGLAKHVSSRTATSMRGAGSLPWQSPEMLQNAGKKTFESDVYAFGITIYEVLSGKEPYSHHLGLFSLINGVVLGGERPPKDPSAGSDGSSYLQFWDEAEKCWDGEPTRRPSMLDVLRHLDPQRFEVLVTSQQILLEKSLNVGAQAQTHFQVAMALPPFSLEVESLEPVQLARQIQARMHSLHNSRLPITRLPTETIACVILEASPVAPFLDTKTYINALTNWAQLRTVCKAWCRAVDNTPEFWRHIWVHRGGHNIAHLQRLNVVESVRCLVTGWETDSLLRDETLRNSLNLISELRSELDIGDMSRWSQAWFPPTHGGYPNLSSLTMSVRSTNRPSRGNVRRPPTFEFNGAPPTLVLQGLTFQNFNPDLFFSVQVLKIVNTMVGNSFIRDICAFIHTASNITELHLQSITRRRPGSEERWGRAGCDLSQIPNFPSKNSTLRVVRLVGSDCWIATEVLNCLSRCRLKVLEVDTLEQKCLGGPMNGGSAIAEGLDFLLLTGEISLTVKRRMMFINFTKFGGLVMTGNNEGWKLESARIGFSTEDRHSRTELVKQLAARGMRALSDSVIFASVIDKRYSPSLSHAKVLVIERDNAREKIKELISTTQRSAQYFCPLLEQLIVMEVSGPFYYNDFDDSDCKQQWWTFVISHQDKASYAGSRIAKLKRLGLPSAWIRSLGHDKRNWIKSQGIEVCDTSSDEFLLSFGS